MSKAANIVWKNDRNVSLSGTLDEFFNYDDLFDKLPDEVWLDMAQITRINSCGVREWVRRIINCRAKIHYANCPSVVIDQMSMVPQFLGPHSVVESFFSSFVCDECSDEKDILFEVGKDIHPGRDVYDEPDDVECGNCGSSMGFAHNPDIFFSFLSTVKAG